MFHTYLQLVGMVYEYIYSFYTYVYKAFYQKLHRQFINYNYTNISIKCTKGKLNNVQLLLLLRLNKFFVQ